jgi:hypothetical protein
MIRKKIFYKKLFLALILSLCFSLSFGIQEYSLPEALKVLKAIEQAERETSDPNRTSLEKIEITESEFNSYIAYRIEKEKAPVLKELRLKFLKGNRIEGKIVVDLEGQKIPKYLRPKMTLFFGGKVEAAGGRVRFDIKDLFLEGQRIQPAVIDFILLIQARIDNTEPTSIDDWYELPYGIKSAEIRLGKGIFTY